MSVLVYVLKKIAEEITCGFHEAKLDPEDVKARLQDLREIMEKVFLITHAGVE